MGIPSKDLNKGKVGLDFEKDVEDTFVAYSKANIARLAIMPVPTKPSGTSRSGAPLYVRSGKAPFDVYGYLVRNGIMVGAELKASVRKPSLRVIMPDSRGSGLQYHQLDALSGLAGCGGKSRIVWNNGGEIGVLTSESIMVAWRVVTKALQSEQSGRQVKIGAKSIDWALFTTVDYTNLHGTVGFDWLLDSEK